MCPVLAADRERAPPTALNAARAAWLAAVPTAVITLAALVVLGPPLGALVLPVRHLRFWPELLIAVQPEPTEQARFLIALLAPVLLAALTILLMRQPPGRLARGSGRLAYAVELAALGILTGCFAAQRLLASQVHIETPGRVVYFTVPTLIAASAIAGALIAGVRSGGVRARFVRWTAETRARRAGVALVALASVAITLLPAIVTDRSIYRVTESVQYHLQFTYDETNAVLDGRSPLGDFAGQYASLWPYVVAAGMSVLGKTLAVFTGLMALLTGIALLALFDVLRRVTRSSIAALLLFLPLLATSAYRLHGPVVNRFSLVNYFGVLPLRYAGPFLLAWLVARHLDGARPRRTWPLFVASGLVLLNNTDFGIAALGATLAALLWAGGRPSAAALRRLALEVALGLAVALALVTALLLMRTGSPPHFSLLFSYAKVFIGGGFAMYPIKPVIGFSTVIYLTFVIAIGVATVRAIRGEPGRLLTGMLVWSGVFGLGAGSYYVGHSLSEVLTYAFPCWAFSLVLLTVLAVRGLAARVRRRPTPIELACLFGFGLLACSLAQTPVPWAQVQKLASHGAPPFVPVGEDFVREHTRRGEKVLILTTLGHRIAAHVHLVDVEIYTGTRSIQTAEQLDESLRALREAGGHKVFVWSEETSDGVLQRLSEVSDQRAHEYAQGMQMWVTR